MFVTCAGLGSRVSTSRAVMVFMDYLARVLSWLST